MSNTPVKKPFRPFTALVNAVENAVANGGVTVGALIQDVVGLIPAADRPAVDAVVKAAESDLAQVDTAIEVAPAAPTATVDVAVATTATAPVSGAPTTASGGTNPVGP